MPALGAQVVETGSFLVAKGTFQWRRNEAKPSPYRRRYTGIIVGHQLGTLHGLAVQSLGKCGIPGNARSQGRHRPSRPEFIHSESEVIPCQHPKTTDIHVLLRVAGAILKGLKNLNCCENNNNLGRSHSTVKRLNKASNSVLTRLLKNDERTNPPQQ